VGLETSTPPVGLGGVGVASATGAGVGMATLGVALRDARTLACVRIDEKKLTVVFGWSEA
jgi:predicted RNA methylase